MTFSSRLETLLSLCLLSFRSSAMRRHSSLHFLSSDSASSLPSCARRSSISCFFRRASLVTLTTTWAVIGIVLAGLIGRDHHQLVVRQERRDLAASL